MENLEECLYFIFIGGKHLNASWSHGGRCLPDALRVCVRAHERRARLLVFVQGVDLPHPGFAAPPMLSAFIDVVEEGTR